MSTSQSTPSTNDQSFKEGARAQKIERLLTMYEAHVAAVTGRVDENGTPVNFHPATDLDDARLVAHNVRSSLKGAQVRIEVRDLKNRLVRKDTYVFWNKVAALAGIPDYRWPSVDTIRALSRRCDRRVKDIKENPNPFTGIVLVAKAS